ncbi:MAG TPA: NADH-quinone oxidoreductase subunit C [Terriglobales bacterium]|nr:NADH-quinone oxidoreductase subunit C [Terriglobales bacterium]
MIQTSPREQTIVDTLKSRFPDAIKETRVEGKHRVLIEFEKERFIEIAKFLRDEGFDHVKGITGVDFPTKKIIEVLYYVGSYSKTDLEDLLLMLKTSLPRDKPIIASATPVWESAHFHERETFEMFGVKFEGHPDLRKLLTLDNWEGPPPMLKDIKFPEMSQR